MKSRKNAEQVLGKFLVFMLSSGAVFQTTMAHSQEAITSEACRAAMQRAQQEVSGHLANLASPQLERQEKVLLNARQAFLSHINSPAGARQRPSYEGYLQYANAFNSGRYTADSSPAMSWVGFDSFLNRYRETTGLTLSISNNPTLAQIQNPRSDARGDATTTPRLDYEENLLMPWQQFHVNGIAGHSTHEEPIFKACSTVSSPNSGVLGNQNTSLQFCSEINVNTGEIYRSPNGNPMPQLSLQYSSNVINGVPARVFEQQHVNRQLVAAGCPAFEVAHLDIGQNQALAPYFQGPTQEALNRRAAFLGTTPVTAEPTATTPSAAAPVDEESEEQEDNSAVAE